MPQIRERAWWPTVYLAGDGSTYCTQTSAGFLIVSTSQLFRSCLNVLVLSDTLLVKFYHLPDLPDMLLHNQPYLPFVNPDPLKCCWPKRRVVFAEEQHKPCRRNQGRGTTEHNSVCHSSQVLSRMRLQTICSSLLLALLNLPPPAQSENVGWRAYFNEERFQL